MAKIERRPGKLRDRPGADVRSAHVRLGAAFGCHPNDGLKIAGIYVPTLIPLDDRSDINEPGLWRFLSCLIDGGVQALYPLRLDGRVCAPECRARDLPVQLLAVGT